MVCHTRGRLLRLREKRLLVAHDERNQPLRLHGHAFECTRIANQRCFAALDQINLWRAKIDPAAANFEILQIRCAERLAWHRYCRTKFPDAPAKLTGVPLHRSTSGSEFSGQQVNRSADLEKGESNQ